MIMFVGILSKAAGWWRCWGVTLTCSVKKKLANFLRKGINCGRN